MSDFDMVKLVTDAGVGLFSLVVLYFVVRTGGKLLEANETRVKTAEARETAAQERAVVAIRETEAALRSLTEANTRILDLEAQLQESVETINSLRKQLERATRRLEAAEARLQEATHETNQDRIALDSSYRELRAENKRLREENESLRRQVASETLEREPAD